MIELKINNVYHNELDKKPNDIEKYIKEYIRIGNVEDLNVMWGDTNSSIFVYLDGSSKSLKNYKQIVRDAVNGFSSMVGGVDADKTTRDDNIRIGRK